MTTSQPFEAGVREMNRIMDEIERIYARHGRGEPWRSRGSGRGAVRRVEKLGVQAAVPVTRGCAARAGAESAPPSCTSRASRRRSHLALPITAAGLRAPRDRLCTGQVAGQSSRECTSPDSAITARSRNARWRSPGAGRVPGAALAADRPATGTRAAACYDVFCRRAGHRRPCAARHRGGPSHPTGPRLSEAWLAGAWVPNDGPGVVYLALAWWLAADPSRRSAVNPAGPEGAAER